MRASAADWSVAPFHAAKPPAASTARGSESERGPPSGPEARRIAGSSSGGIARSSNPSKALMAGVQHRARPTAVLLHGLDSSRETWRASVEALAARGFAAVALDLRGHGESPLGDASAFSAAALAEDVLAAIRSRGISRAVLVGHSMGGRIAVRAAAIDAAAPPDRRLLCALVVEDMDMRTRPQPPHLDAAARAALARFGDAEGGPPSSGRLFASWDACREALLGHYEPQRIDGWRGSRLRQRADGRWWSDISPLAQRLARERVLGSADGSAAWAELAAAAPPLPVHVWRADEAGSACQLGGAGGLAEMAAHMPGARVRHFEGASHSIHRTDAGRFEDALCGVLDEGSSVLDSGLT